MAALLPLHVAAQETSAPGLPDPLAVYRALESFELSGAGAQVDGLRFQRDRLELEFTGRFYFSKPVAGGVRGAVFIGSGTFRAAPPPGFESDNVRRLLKADAVESTFESAVLRFTDDTFAELETVAVANAPVSPKARELAAEFGDRMLRDSGINLAARLAISLLNHETPGLFVIQLDGGKRGRFTAVLDHQTRIQTSSFGINAGEKGIIYARHNKSDEVWMAFPSQRDYERGDVTYASAFDLVSVNHYDMSVDVREPKENLRIEARLELESRVDGLRAIPFSIGESLPDRWSERLKKALRVTSATLEDSGPITAVQEDWETGVTLLLPAPRATGDRFAVTLELEGDYMFDSDWVRDCYYPRSPFEWYPHHGELSRATFDVTFLHDRRHTIAGTGLLASAPTPRGSDMITRWRVEQPVIAFGFGVGKFERHTASWKVEGNEIPVDFFALPDSKVQLKEEFILAEMMNSLTYFQKIFGSYPYKRLGGVYHPRPYGQGIAGFLLLPGADRANRGTFAFIAHEVAHQWWGNIVAWRSYRDQWLSEGFAQYSGALYTGLRKDRGAERDMLEDLRRSLTWLPGGGRGRMTDVGPLILGNRLSTRKTGGAYQTLIYNKGALVLRMLHFLFTNPATGNGQPFFDMMSDFVDRHRGQWASTEGFVRVANEHFKRTPLARRYGLEDLNWFFAQWVYQTDLPNYRLDYRTVGQTDGSVLIEGTIFQDDAPPDWRMLLPVVFRFDGDQHATTTVQVVGPESPVRIKLPMRPRKVELDPALWVLSEKSKAKAR